MAPAAKRRKTEGGHASTTDASETKKPNTRSRKSAVDPPANNSSPTAAATRPTRSTKKTEVKKTEIKKTEIKKASPRKIATPKTPQTSRTKASVTAAKAAAKIADDDPSLVSAVGSSSIRKPPAKRPPPSQYLKDADWNVSSAVDAYFSTQGPKSKIPTPAQDASVPSLSAIFDQYRDGGKESPDTMGVDGAQRYFSDLNVDLESPAVLVVSELLQSQEFGSFTRSGFVEGWKKLGAGTMANQKAAVPRLTAAMASDTNAFKRIYRHTFILAKPPGQRAVPLETAIAMWTILYSPPSISWNSRSMRWLDLWTEFLNGKWKKTVNKDMWNMTGEFQKKTVALDKSGLDTWDSNGTWPVVIDEFVLWVKEKLLKDPALMEID